MGKARSQSGKHERKKKKKKTNQNKVLRIDQPPEADRAVVYCNSSSTLSPNYGVIGILPRLVNRTPRLPWPSVTTVGGKTNE